MERQVVSVTDRLRPYAEASQQFTGVRAAWAAFLGYLQARRGADIRSTHRLEQIEAAFRYVKSESFEQLPSGYDPDAESFRAFERREDVLTALDRFFRDRGLLP